tara:strand:+ start:67272 stop:67919 length:648 start_codon:yes stop_codon:yes gene_type:complete
MALPIRSALRSAGRFMVRNPLSVLTVAKHAMSMRVAIPLDALRWVVANTPPGKKAPTDIAITARPPAIQMGATIEMMGTKLRASTTITVEELRVFPEEMTVRLRLTDTDMKVLDRSETPIAGLIRSGALDLSKPGNLVKFMPQKPALLAEAKDDILVLDLMQVPKLANNFRLRKVLQRITPVMNVSALGTDGDYLVVSLKATPGGLPRALSAGAN